MSVLPLSVFNLCRALSNTHHIPSYPSHSCAVLWMKAKNLWVFSIHNQHNWEASGYSENVSPHIWSSWYQKKKRHPSGLYAEFYHEKPGGRERQEIWNWATSADCIGEIITSPLWLRTIYGPYLVKHSSPRGTEQGKPRIGSSETLNMYPHFSEN